jgi:hypothetical protein
MALVWRVVYLSHFTCALYLNKIKYGTIEKILYVDKSGTALCEHG